MQMRSFGGSPPILRHPTSARTRFKISSASHKANLTPAYISYFIFYKYPCLLDFSYTDLYVSQPCQAHSYLRTFALSVLSAWVILPPRSLKAWLLMILVYLLFSLSRRSSLASPYKLPISSRSSVISSLCLIPFWASSSFRCSCAAAVSPLRYVAPWEQGLVSLL